MARFVTIGYGDQEGYDRTDPQVMANAHADDARHQAAGTLMGIAGTPMQVRNHDGTGVVRTGGAFAATTLPVAGFAVIEAADLDEAVAIASDAPCAVGYGVVEVWPLLDPPG
jgi:hypothetical protein